LGLKVLHIDSIVKLKNAVSSLQGSRFRGALEWCQGPFCVEETASSPFPSGDARILAVSERSGPVCSWCV
jgi:hypothetical protein